MIDIGLQWHVSCVVDDHQLASEWYRRVFAARDVFTDEWLESEKRWASMFTIADLGIEVMSPTPEAAELPLGRFRKRFGQHLHAAAYFVNSDPLEVFDALTAQGVRCVGLAGSGRNEVADNALSPVFTHPKDTAGQLEFMPFVETKPGPIGVPEEWEDPRFVDGWSCDPWRDHPLAVGGWRIGVVVHDLDRAFDVYRALGARIVADEDTADAKRRSLRLGANTTVELIRPNRDDTLAARDLAANGEILHSFILEVGDLVAAESHLCAQGVVVAERYEERLATDPESCYGAVFELVPERVIS